MIPSSWTDRSGQCRPRSDYSFFYDQGLHWLFAIPSASFGHISHYGILKPHFSSFMIFTAILSGDKIFKKFKVCKLMSRSTRLWYFSSSVKSFFKRACVAIQWGQMSGLLVGPFVYLLPYFMCANSEGSDETARMRRLAWAFAVHLCDKYHNLELALIMSSMLLLHCDVREAGVCFFILYLSFTTVKIISLIVAPALARAA